ncbi:MAG: prolyl oligopeptidase family serine peptidase [Bacteroidia bacterium]|nr:prolyl oligopeptidase family serine peptidase [Bacteroidia bacterium]
MNRFLFCTGLYILVFPHLFSQSAPIIITQALGAETSRYHYGRIIHADPVLQSLSESIFVPPKSGTEITLADKKSTWQNLQADEDGWFSGPSLRGGYVYVNYRSTKEKIVILEEMGNLWGWVNGEFRIGNQYQSKDTFEPWEPDFSFSMVPVKLKKGNNHLVFRCNRGRFKLKIHESPASVLLNTKDATLPDLLIGEIPDYRGGIVVVNAKDQSVEGYQMEVSFPGENVQTLSVGFLPPLGMRKIAFPIKGTKPVLNQESTPVLIRIRDISGAILAESSLHLRHRLPQELHKRTYQSAVDGSIQYFAVNPATESDGPKALALSVHGANVEGLNQAASYYQKPWIHIVSPTNRRPYGYNWEDWGRMDALAVLEETRRLYDIDPARVYLTGHSMGGHGTWSLGATFPDHWAAIAPSAGYMNLVNYYSSFVPQQSPEENTLIRRSRNMAMTDSMALNYKQNGVYVLHGGADDVVRPEQARYAVSLLEKFHRDFVYHEEPGMGHWWDISDENGTDCVDWQPIFDFFARHIRPGKDKIREINFVTAHPGISSSNYWATIYDQQHKLAFSKIHLRLDPGQNRVSGTTENVSILAIDSGVFEGKKTAVIVLDGDTMKVPVSSDQLFFAHDNKQWRPATQPSASAKGPHRYSNFRDVINHRVVFVYGTVGTPDENRWALQKARYDAESFWYQGNGAIEVIPDYLYSAEKYTGRNVVLFGHSENNLAWKQLLDESPVQVRRGEISMAEETYTGNNLAAVFIRPKKGSDTNLVGVIGGTGVKGMSITGQILYLYPGFALPDLVILDEKTWTGGKSVLAGYFGSDWSVEKGEWE